MPGTLGDLEPNAPGPKTAIILKVDAILPAAGSATRMRGLPKFLLPCDENYLSLLERHINHLAPICNKIWIPIRPDLIALVESLNIPAPNTEIFPISTNTMTETLRKTASKSMSEKFVMVMPDTYFQGELPYEYLATGAEKMNLACWKIRAEQYGKLGQVQISKSSPEETQGTVSSSRDKDPSCRFPFSWGAMSFSREVLELADDEMPHLGYVLPQLLEKNMQIHAKVIDGEYFDCGTPQEYISMLQDTTAQA